MERYLEAQGGSIRYYKFLSDHITFAGTLKLKRVLHLFKWIVVDNMDP